MPCRESRFVFPAHAGMNRLYGLSGMMFQRVPRPRGDEPSFGIGLPLLKNVFPAHAGMNRDVSAASSYRRRVPRPRGDEPGIRDGEIVGNRCSPPTRG